MKPALKTQIVGAVGETDRPIENRFEARRRARQAGEDAIAVLRSEGYYAYEVEPDVTEADPPQPVVRVNPGKRFVIADPTIEWVGTPPGDQVQQAGEAVMGLANGQAGRAADVVGAEGRIVAATQKRGYADVSAAPRVVTVDHADRTVRPDFKIVAGDLVRLDGVSLTTTGRTNMKWLRKLTPWKPGEVYDPEDVGELERRLLDTGVYDSVTVSLAPREQTSADGLRPVIVSVADRAYRRLELGASYATSEGAGADARWTRYNRFGRGDTVALFARASTVDSRAGMEISLPHWRRAQQTLKATAQVYRQLTSAYDETGAGISADVTRRFGKTSYLTLGASLDYGRTDEVDAGVLVSRGRNQMTAALLGALALDRSDDPLDPKRGWRVETRVEPTLITGDGSLPYLKLQSQGTVYFPFDAKGRSVLAGRLKLGSIVGGAIPEVPASRRLYAGGGGSVRGYTYQAIGPHLSDNTPEGGLSLIEASVEYRQKIGKRWGVVGFLDAGSIGSDQVPNGKNLSLGAGVGIRYDLGFGPIRVDLAIPLNARSNDPRFQIYLSIGQSF
ncbi:MAG TPA: autotransporter assembly complex family protein [Phenylobacterium sp.]|nr:autotransporter assembly complex family protein [Phenylobacterium sp.]